MDSGYSIISMPRPDVLKAQEAAGATEACPLTAAAGGSADALAACCGGLSATKGSAGHAGTDALAAFGGGLTVAKTAAKGGPVCCDE